MDLNKLTKIAIADSCQFSLLGLSMIFQQEINHAGSMNLACFRNINDVIDCDDVFDIIIYDPLRADSFPVNTEQDVFNILEKNPECRIYIYSACVGYLKLDKVDGVFNKEMPLHELHRMCNYIINVEARSCRKCTLQLSFTRCVQLYLSDDEASVLRGYSCNLKTKQIARLLGCEVKMIYFYKKKAMQKLNAVHGPLFYQNISCIIN